MARNFFSLTIVLGVAALALSFAFDPSMTSGDYTLPQKADRLYTGSLGR